MHEQVMQISVDYALILRVCLGLIWGAGWALFLQITRNGKFLVEERTWITVILGVGVDLLIAYPWAGGNGDWFTVAIVISTSSVGIIIRSLHNEQKQSEINTKGYKVIWGLEDAIVVTQRAIDQLTKILDTGQLGQGETSQVSKAISTLQRLRLIIQDARRGEYSQKNGQSAKSEGTK